jgi:hypothetical protein
MSEGNIQEKSLLELWSKTLPKIPKNRFNSWVSMLGLLFGVLPFVIGPIEKFVAQFQPYTDLLATVYAGLLGFIIAGYAIFTTAGNPKFLLEIWKHTDKRSGLPLLKLHLLVFVRLFIVVFVSMLIVLLQSLLFRMWPSFSGQVQLSDRIINLIQALSLGSIGWTVTASSVQLKTLIFNLYDLTITQVQFLQIEETKKKDEEK